MITDELHLIPGVLVATPSLLDPNFHHTVILMLQHDEEGSLGLVLNRPTKHPCAEVARSLDIEWGLDENHFISVGGPVEPQSLWMVHPNHWLFEESIQIGSGLAVSRSESALRDMCMAREERLRMFIGYAGWGPGQLEQEIKDGSWIITEATNTLIFQTADAEVWDLSLIHI